MAVKGVPYITGVAIGLKQAGVTFDILAEYSGCWLCGDVFQSKLDLLYYECLQDYLNNPTSPIEPDQLSRLKMNADAARDEWRTKHSESHSSREHEMLARNPDLCTPEAAAKLAPLGIFPLEFGKDVREALQEAPRVPEGRIFTR